MYNKKSTGQTRILTARIRFEPTIPVLERQQAGLQNLELRITVIGDSLHSLC